jgi:transcription termination/antitermination protein NusG
MKPQNKEEGNKAINLMWYAVRTKANMEDMVLRNIERRIKSFGMQEHFDELFVPKTSEIVIKNGRKRVQEKKMFPGYVLVKMNVTEETWYMVRNTEDVTGFLGVGTMPSPMPEEEVNALKSYGEQSVQKSFEIDLILGDLVTIIDGYFKNFEAKVISIDKERGRVSVMVSMFGGKETALTLDVLQVKKQ